MIWRDSSLFFLFCCCIYISLVVCFQYMNEKYNFSPHGMKAKLGSLGFLIFSNFIADFPVIVGFFFSFFKNPEKSAILAELLYFLIWKQCKKYSTYVLFPCCGLHCCNPSSTSYLISLTSVQKTCLRFWNLPISKSIIQ